MKKTKKDSAFKEPVISKSQGGFIETIFNYPYLLIILFPIACFGRTIFFEFLNYDDQLFIVENKKLISDFSNVSKVFSTGIWSFIHFVSTYDYYRPFLILSMMADAQMGGSSPVIYHLSNLLYHVIACLLVYRLFIKINIKKKSSLLLTLLFSVHPIVTQAIAWIPGRNDTLLAIFILASFINFIKYIETEKIVFLVFHFVFFFFGLLTKETAVLLPVICLLYSTFILQKKLFSKHTFICSFIWIIITLTYFYFRAKAIGKTENEVTLQMLLHTVIYRLPAIVQYIGKMILPFNLSVKPTQQDTSYLPGIISVLIITVSLFLSKEKNYKQMLLGFIWFILFLAPVLSLPKIFNDNIFEHRAYLPLIGMLILLNESFVFKNKPFTGRNGIIISTVAIVIFFFISFNHSKYFKTAFVFWQNAALNSPNDSEAQINFSSQYFNKGDKQNAEIYIQKALALKPDIKRANAGLGAIYADRGELEKAEIYYKAEIKLGSRYIEDFRGLGTVLMNLKNDSDAILCFEKALLLDSADNNINSNLGFLYFTRQNYDAAKKIWERMLLLYPTQLHLHENLAILYSRTGDFEKAISYAVEEEKLGGKMPEGFIQIMNEQLKMKGK
ncbi:MAG TPA: tetratricopeptide repeat protein [Bacteroidia bacterium]|nr:tetratricopeptide repeat protein [Bacteroidia bacterium]